MRILILRMSAQTVAEIVARALAEDVGDGDVTTAATVPEHARARATITQKAPGVAYGLDVAVEAFRALDPEMTFERLVEEGRWRERRPRAGARGLRARDPDGRADRFELPSAPVGCGHDGRPVCAAVDGTGAVILDTRKTTPGLRALEKAAVAAGGATNHRAGLFDAILIKENHAALAGGVGEAVRQARAHAPELQLEVECRTLAEVDEALAAGAGFLLLDNMSVDELRAAVDRVAGRAKLEASGGFTLDTIRAVAGTGVNFISVGAITHSAPALDLSLLLESIP